jgi:hypothetical protein
MRFKSCSSVCVRQELQTAVELVNGRRSRTELTAASEGVIIAAVGQEQHKSRDLTLILGMSSSVKGLLYKSSLIINRTKQ